MYFQFTVDMEFSFEFLYDSDVCMIAINTTYTYIVYLFTNMSQMYRFLLCPYNSVTNQVKQF